MCILTSCNSTTLDSETLCSKTLLISIHHHTYHLESLAEKRSKSVTSLLQTKGPDDMFPGVDIPLTFSSPCHFFRRGALGQSELQEEIGSSIVRRHTKQVCKPINMHVYGFCSITKLTCQMHLYTYAYMHTHTHTQHTHTHTHTHTTHTHTHTPTGLAGRYVLITVEGNMTRMKDHSPTQEA